MTMAPSKCFAPVAGSGWAVVAGIRRSWNQLTRWPVECCGRTDEAGVVGGRRVTVDGRRGLD